MNGYILLPLAAALVVNLPVPGVRRAAWHTALIAACVQGIVAAAMLADRMRGVVLRGFPDGLSSVMLLTAGLVFVAGLLTARACVSESNRQSLLGSLALLGLAGINGIVLATDLFTMYVYLEAAAVVFFVFIAFDRDSGGLEASFKYLLLSGVATVFLLTGIGILLLATGSTSFDGVSAAVSAGGRDRNIVLLAAACIVCGLLVKAGLMPFHGWLPDAYSAAPSWASVLLAGIVTKTAGIYTLVRVSVAIFGAEKMAAEVFLVVGIVSVVAAAVAALGQRNLKRMLAYSSISQVGYIVLGLAAGTPLGIAGAIVHIFNHAVFKSLLFVNAAALEHQAGTCDIPSLAGRGRQMPVTGATSVLAVLSAAGIPPLGGFWSKLLIVMALWSAGWHALAVVAVGASVLTLGYLLVFNRQVFFAVPKEPPPAMAETGADILVPALILAAVVVGVGLVFPLLPESFLLTLTEHAP